jgi:hypothetical protein
MSTPLEELRAIGLTVDLPDESCRRLWGALVEIDGAHRDTGFSISTLNKALRDVYDAIASVIITSRTSDDVLETMIPNMVDAFHLKREWQSFNERWYLNSTLEGSITRWKGKKLQMEEKQPASEELEFKGTGSKVDPPLDCSSMRRAQIDAFLQICNRLSARRIHRRHIWLAVEHSTGRQFEYWQACNSKATAEDGINFARVLVMEPVNFLALLVRKKLILD